MQYSNIRSRAGLVALVFALIISLVSAAPIPATESGLSSSYRSLYYDAVKVRIKHDTAKHSFSGRMSTLPSAVATRALTRREAHASTDVEDQLVRRSRIGAKIKRAFQKLGHKIKKGFQKVGNAIKKGLKKVKQGFVKAGTTIKQGFRKVGRAIKTAAKKVGRFLKNTGKKIVKFGLKIFETAGKAFGKVASFIPGVGKVLSKGFDAIANGAGRLSDTIHANLGKKLDKGMNVMNKVNKVMRFIPRRRELSEEEAFQRRDISDAHYFEERDDIALEGREVSYFEAYYERDIYERYDLDEE